MVLAVGKGEHEPADVEDGWTSHLLLLVALPLPYSPTTALHLNTIITRVFHCLPKCRW